MLRWKFLLVAACIPACVLAPAEAQTVDRVISSFGAQHPLTRPVQLALSPTGNSIAVSDRSANRIYVFDSEGLLLWSVGEVTAILEPVAVCFDGEDALLFSCNKSRVILRVTKTLPNSIDTTANLDSLLPVNATIDQILETTGKAHLILDQRRSAIYRFTFDWQKDKELIGSGGRKGELWQPAGMATDLSGNIIVADGGSFPMQVFSPAGRFLFSGGWNRTAQQQIWNATAVTVTRNEQICVSDVTSLQWRVFDRTGNEVGQYQFEQPIFHPNAVVSTPDGRLIVADERGAIIILRLS